MTQEMILVPRKEYELLLEEVGILQDASLMEAIRESDKAKNQGVKTWKLNI